MMGNFQSDNKEKITPSNNINSLLKDNVELKEKYYKIKIKRKSYKNRIRILEKKVDKLTNKLTELEIQSRDHYTISNRGSSTSHYLNNRIIELEKKLNNTIILQPQKNNLPFCIKKKK